jgi:hypothetical protein
MRICKYCNKPIAEKDIWNPDNDGNGYHHKCLIDMEFKARDRQIYDKGKMDAFDKIRAEIDKLQTYKTFVGESTVYVDREDVLAIIDKYRTESEGKE